MKILSILIILTLIVNINSKAQPFRLKAVSDMTQVFEDGYNMTKLSDTINVFGIRGEIVSGQFVITTKNNLTDVTVEPGILNNGQGSLTALWNFVGSVPLSKNASNQPEQAVVRKAPARFPDFLMAERQKNINKGTNQPVYLTISIPNNAAAGLYSGRITVRSAQGDQSIPVKVEVYPLTLPDRRTLKVTEWYSTKFDKYHGISEQYSDAWFAMLARYAENMVAHRQNIFRVPANSIKISKTANGEFEFDFSLFDRIADVFWNTGKMDYLETGELAETNTGSFNATDIIFKDFPVTAPGGEKITVKGDEMIPHLLPALERHLREKGWLEKTYFHIKDEPAHHTALGWIRSSRTVHHYAPDLRRMDALCTSFVLSDIDVACPKLDHLDAGYDVYRKWQEKGNELWFYTVGIFQGSMYPNKTIDMPVIGSRILHWLNYKYDATGFLHWGWNQWVDDPFNETGQHTGDGYHVYPVKDGVLNTMRWEQMRNGIQDYECFRMLEEKVQCLKDSLGASFSWIDPTQRGKEITSRVASSLVRHSTDPGVLNSSKKQLLHEIMDFNVSPRFYIQTNPLEHKSLINRDIVELLGWAEPGTRIIINEQEIPVAKNGFFVLRHIIYVGGKLDITAVNKGIEKHTIREFNVTY